MLFSSSIHSLTFSMFRVYNINPSIVPSKIMMALWRRHEESFIMATVAAPNLLNTSTDHSKPLISAASTILRSTAFVNVFVSIFGHQVRTSKDM